jgi:hypothetical protein
LLKNLKESMLKSKLQEFLIALAKVYKQHLLNPTKLEF